MSDRVTGLRGVFFRARDPGAYERVLGIRAEDLMRSDGLVFGIFDAEGNRFELWEPAEGM
jgi:hypothetical protein